MIIVLVLLTIFVFVLVDFSLRTVMTRIQERKSLQKREEALDIGLKLVFSDEAKSLKRVEIENPKARILAVDDEAIILDSFRKILVIAGYSVDTVEDGREALYLLRDTDANYDFVFTDLKMPHMDGLEVTKGVKHLCPDIDVIMITGFATIESAVDAMKYGALDYVQKPFTEEELVEFVDKSLVRRNDRIDRQILPSVHMVTPSISASKSRHEFNVPAGVFISPAHTWVNIYPNGTLVVGLDDFAQKLIGSIDEVDLPVVGSEVKKDEPLFSVKQGAHELTFSSPASGKITSINKDVIEVPDLVNRKPFESGWLCGIEPSNLPSDLQTLRIGADASDWYQEEIYRYYEMTGERSGTDDKSVRTDEDERRMAEKMDSIKWEVLAAMGHVQVETTD